MIRRALTTAALAVAITLGGAGAAHADDVVLGQPHTPLTDAASYDCRTDGPRLCVFDTSWGTFYVRYSPEGYCVSIYVAPLKVLP